jgi:hypothetical protein
MRYVASLPLIGVVGQLRLGFHFFFFFEKKNRKKIKNKSIFFRNCIQFPLEELVLSFFRGIGILLRKGIAISMGIW